MSNIIATDAQRLEQDNLIELFELDARQYGEGVLRFCEGPVDGAAPQFNGYTYQPVPIDAQGFKWDGQGTLPAPTLTLSIMDPALSSLIRQADDLVGAPIRRIRTYRRYLDDGISPDPEATFPIDDYIIERKTKHNSVVAEFELSVSFDQRGKKIPGRQVIRDTCTHSYRRWNGTEFEYHNVTCPYSGRSYFNKAGYSTVVPGQDECGKRLSDCEKRFGNSALPFAGFPGAGRL